MIAVTIGDLCGEGQASIQTGPFGSQLHAHEYTSEGVPVVPTEAIRDGVILHEAVNRIPPQVAARLDRHALRQGDILFARRGVQATGHSARVREAETGWICGTGAIRLRLSPSCRTVDGRWLAHLLAGGDAVRWFKQHAIGATMPNLNEGIIRAFPLRLPPIGEQRSAADLLDALHNKIALNARMNATLEAMARAVFEDWFVRFGPVRAKAEGRAPPDLAPDLAALFPDRLTEMPDGEVPEGWRQSTIGHEADCVGGSTPSTDAAHLWHPAEHAWATPKDLAQRPEPFLLATDRKISGAGLAGISSGLLPVGSVLLSSRAPIGYRAITAIPVAINQGFIGLRCSRSASPEFIYLWLGANMDSIHARANGSTFMEISKSSFRPIPLILPPEPIMAGFVALVRPMFERIHANQQETRTLTGLRDLLLPRLISGKLRLRDAERTVEAAL